jgi:branched-chain amino acid transport system ATP-binding protein
MSVNDGKKLLHVESIDVSYGKLKVIFDVSLYIDDGEVVVLVGRNGAGKTTLFRTIAGFLKIRKGAIRYREEEINPYKAFEVAQKGIRYIHQDKHVFSTLSVSENLELAGHAIGNKDWSPVFEYFPKIETLLDRRAGNLSGGERQMLLIAMALLGKPDLILMDEPTEGLAPHIITDLATSFKKISKTTTLFIIEQNLPLTAQIADRVYCMREGGIVAEIESKDEIKKMSFEKYL